MDLFSLLITLIVVGVLLWLVNTYIPLDPTIKRIINIVTIIIVVLWLLRTFVGGAGVGNIRVGR